MPFSSGGYRPNINDEEGTFDLTKFVGMIMIVTQDRLQGRREGLKWGRARRRAGKLRVGEVAFAGDGTEEGDGYSFETLVLGGTGRITTRGLIVLM